ncbi:PREDICTED: serine/threonine-protein kinase CTR1-like isoform X1 [Populus euphratica]|uniref:non-specific serine/threonine protein kinase n=1 Tax=Populus euphratica TaxID=75702 RepID=A0AAJ6UPB8_POPEU|nr:PREDICTED: serine/threonine-protein kinase CTR1-like isoform X1 [Populus euphratica]XP_011032807.1 PREDICTED: serine/threonine-protein kinase CTR1-like isoform X1 [Populus euphratica]
MDSWCGGEATIKSRAKQTEESYQLQLALALRLSSQAASANDPNFLDFSSSDNTKRGLPPYSPESLSHRFWVNGSLSYFDRIPDGFYVIHGLDPYTWSISADSRVPSFESLKAVNDLSIGVVLIDRFRDPGLKEVHNRVIGLSSSLSTTEDVVKHLAIVVCNLMGGLVPNEDDNAFAECWKECTEAMKRRFRSVVLPIGSLSIGLCVHRALLFKVLADSINLPCRIVKGCKYCRRDVVSSCLVQVGNDREYFVDLLRNPGALSQPDSSFNSSSSILVSSPLSHPRFKSNQTTEDFRTLAKLYFLDSQPLNLVFDNSSSGTAIDEDDKFISRLSKDKKNLLPTSSNNRDTSLSSSVLPVRQKYTDPVISNPKRVATNNLLFMELNQSIPSKSNNQLHLEEEDLVVPWSELLLKNKIGSGSFGTVYHADWRGSDVAVKILEEQEFHAERFEEFLSEVAIMKRLRHPNIVLFMGAVTQPPNLSIVMEYLSRGSLHKLLHMNDAALILDERRCLNMAYDVAKGMNYLHQFRPPIVHRDLKSLNLLVDSTYTVKICDFGLSRSKAKTYISSTNAAGRPEWMAPEVLRNERSNEKSDVYSFGVILWELMTLQQPWRNLKQAQIIEAVGFMGQRLEIPSSVNPSVAALIDVCLDNEPSKRPPFSYIMETLQELISNSISQPVAAQVR